MTVTRDDLIRGIEELRHREERFRLDENAMAERCGIPVAEARAWINWEKSREK